MHRKIYFTGSIRGGRADANLYHEMIDFMKKTDIVLTEHVGSTSLHAVEQELDEDQAIYEQDTAWLRECDLLIGECTCPSLGVGYELAYAENHNKECHIFYCKSKCELSAMLRGDSYFHIHPYETKEELFTGLNDILSNI